MTRKKGRRPLADEPSTAIVNMRVTPGQRIDLQRVATDNGTNVSGVLREAVTEFVAASGERRVFRRPPKA